MKRCLLALSTLALLLLVADRALATQTSTTLGILLQNGWTVTAGDKLFDRWYVSGDTGSVDPNQISVIALADGGLDPGPGLRFVANQGVFSVEDGEFLTYTIGFRVTVLDPTLRIKDNSLNLVSYAVDAEDEEAGVSIREIVGTAQGLDDLGVKYVEYSESDFDPTISILSDSATFPQQSQVWVQKTINLWAEDEFDFADLFEFQQRFSQEPAVPEPVTSALGLLALGAVGLSAARRRCAVRD